MKRFLLITCSALLLTMTGCSNSEKNTENTEVASETDADTSEETYPWLPVIQHKDEILLYDRFYGQVVRYDRSNFETTTNEDHVSYQYEFNNLTSDIYTSLYLEESNFKIIRLNDDKAEVLYTTKDGETLYPVAYKDEENMYMVKCTYADDGTRLIDEQIICSFDAKTGKLTPIKGTKGFDTACATIIDDTLYFTTRLSNDDDTFSYELYKTDVTKDESPELIDDSLAEGELYNNNGTLWAADKDNIYEYENKENKFKKSTYNYFYNEYLFQIATQDDSDDMTLSIIDTKTKKEIKSFAKIIDFKISDDIVTVYRDYEVTTFGLNR